MALTLVGARDVAAQLSAESTAEANAAALLEKHSALSGALAQNQYRRPLFLESAEGLNTINGNAYAVLDSPFNTVSATFKSPAKWCEVMILHLNTKYCRATADTSPSTLMMNIGRKTAQSLKDAFALEFDYRQVAFSSNYMATRLNAEKGPLGTSNYRIELQAVPLPGGKTFMHLTYSYSYGVASRLAMRTYLATLGSGKVGFTEIQQGEKSAYIGGMRGAVERNTMRYYLAIEAYLASLGQPPAEQFNARLQHWFDATEEYALQLHEVDKSSYVTMKKDEYQRQQAAPSS